MTKQQLPKRLTLCMVLLAIAIMLPYTPRPTEANGDWSLMILDAQFNTLVQIFDDGSQVMHDLELTEEYQVYWGHIAVNPAGTLAAYCMIDYTQESTESPPLNTVTLTLRDLQTASTIAQIDLGNADDCRLSEASFSTDGSRFAVGLLAPFQGSGPIWQVLVFDATSGKQIHELNADSPLVESVTVDDGAAVMPDPRFFEGDTLVFGLMYWFTEGPPTSPAMQWNMADGTLTDVTDRWEHVSFDFLPETGEMVWIEQNANLPFGNPGGPMMAGNVVNVADSSGQTQTIYFNGEYIITHARFIDDGQRVAVALLESFDYESDAPEPQEYLWVAVRRDGSVEELVPPSLDYSEIRGVPGGYALLTTGYSSPEPTPPASLVIVDSAGDSVLAWEGSGYQNIIWTAPVPTASDLSPFPAFPTP